MSQKEIFLDFSSFDNKIVVKFAYDEEIVKKIKSISMRRWDYINKRWIFPFVVSKYEEIKNFFEQEGYRVITSSALKKEIEKNVVRKIDDKEIDKDLKLSLYSFQKEAVAFLKDTNGRGIIAYEMGLGKTVIALAFVHSYSLYPVLVVCPKMLIHHWEREVHKFLKNKEVSILKNDVQDIKDINIINYDRLKKVVELFKENPFKTIIFDESHFLKNYKAARTRLAINISKKCEHVILLTGTPLLNRPIELYTQIKIVNPHLFDYKNYTERYCNAEIVKIPTRNGIIEVRNVKGASNLDELKEKLKSVMIRKLKKDVLTELPPKIVSVIPVTIENQNYQQLLFSPELFIEVQKYQEYIKKLEMNAEKEIITDIEQEFNKIRLYGMIEKLKQEAVRGKLEQACEFIENMLEQNEKVVVFVHHKFVVEELKKRFKDALVITGETPPDERIKNLDEFRNNSEKQLLIASIRVAGYGLDLSVSNTAVFLEFDWNYHTHLQCEDRLHRLGQTQSVNIYYLVALNTIEEKICQLIDAKRKVVAGAIDDLKVELLSRVDMLKNLADYLLSIIDKKDNS